MNHYHAPHVAGMSATTGGRSSGGYGSSGHSRSSGQSGSSSKWMQRAVPPSHRGRFSAKAKAAGYSTAAYAKKEAGAKGTLGKEARLAETFEKEAKAKKG